MKKPPLELDQQLCFALYRASRALTRTYAPLLDPLGVTYPQYLVLLVLWEEDDVPVKHLGARLALDSATLTPLLKRLEQQGIVQRRRDADDERVVRIALTTAGRALRREAERVPLGIACRAGFDPADPAARDDLATLRDRLLALADTLEAPTD
jgi:MarR family transcriptional regulator, organic hydroperoxide resistance regulator